MSFVEANIPRKCYPRYDYTAKYVTRLTRKCNNLIRSCGLRPPCKNSVFDHVNVRIQTSEGKPLLSDEQIIYKPMSEGKLIEWKDLDNEDLYSNRNSDKIIINPTILIYSSPELKNKTYSGSFDIELCIADSNFHGSPSKRFKGVKTETHFESVLTESEFAQHICFSLERFTLGLLRQSFEVVKVLAKEKTGVNLKSLINDSEEIEDVLKQPAVAEYLNTLLSKYKANQSRKCSEENQYVAKQNTFEVRDRLEGFSYLLDEDFEQKRSSMSNGQEARNNIAGLTKHLELTNLPDKRQKLKDVITECTYVYLRSSVPEQDTFQLNHTLALTDEQVSSDLFASVPDVISCGYRLGTFHVYCKQSLHESDDLLRENIKLVLEKNGISEFVLRYEPAEIRKCFNYSVGSEIVLDLMSTASLGVIGGYAWKGTDRKLCALTTRHTTDLFLESGSIFYVKKLSTLAPVNFGIVLQPREEAPQSLHPVDISAIRMHNHLVQDCETRFKSEDNRYVSSNPFPMVNREMLQGRQVHISRANAEPGLGIITTVDLHSVYSRHVIIEDLNSPEEDYEPQADLQQQNPFAREGESGSITVADNPDGDSVDVISMLEGFKVDRSDKKPFERKKYYSFCIEAGLNQLKDEQNEIFQLC